MASGWLVSGTGLRIGSQRGGLRMRTARGRANRAVRIKGVKGVKSVKGVKGIKGVKSVKKP